MKIHAKTDVLKAIHHACDHDLVHLSGKTQAYLIGAGFTRDTLISALLTHLEENREVHAKFHDDGTFSYHGSLCVHPGDPGSIYFEIKLWDEIAKRNIELPPGSIWLQTKPHTDGRTPLSREILR